MLNVQSECYASNPLGVSGNYDRITFAPYYLFKDLITIFIFIFGLSSFVFFMPNVLGDSENYIMANPMQTPAAIVPEWYLLPFYAILRSIPNKIGGVIAMFGSLLILLTIPFTNSSEIRSTLFRPIFKVFYWLLIVSFLILGWIGQMPVDYPYTEVGVIAMVYYFFFFLVVIPFIGHIESYLIRYYNK